MSKSANAALAATMVALALTSPTVRRTTAKLLRKAAKLLDDHKPLPVAPPPMWSDSPVEEEQESPTPKSRTKKMSLKEYAERNALPAEL